MMPDNASTAPRRSFQKRLLMTLGPILALAFVIAGVITWIFAYNWITYSEQMVLDVENREIEAHIMTPADTLNVEAYNWNEPHHRFDSQHIDPYFLQVFDANNKLIRTSANIALFPQDTYPVTLFTNLTSPGWLFRRLHMVEVNGKQLYFRTRSVTNKAGQLLAHIQVSRYDPGTAAAMERTTYFIFLGLTPALMGLLGIVWWAARRVVAPLEQITHEARQLSPTQLNHRIKVPSISDSETALLATSLNGLLDRLEQSFGEMQRFTADAAHELQTPLTILKGHVSVALRQNRSTEEYKKTLSIIHEQTEGLIHLVHSLLQLARLDRDEQNLVYEPINLAAAVSDVATYYKQLALAKGLDFVTQSPGEAWIEGHINLVEEIVKNLLENAVKYTDKGSITLAVQKKKGEVILTVHDTGVGMSEEVRRRATERFYRAPTANARSIPGSGLGLALVTQMVEKQKAAFTIHSVLGEGTTVRVVFSPEAAG